MNKNNNLILIHTRSPEEHKRLSSKGGKNSGKAKRKRKEEREERLALKEILKELLYSEIEDEEIKSKLDGFKINFAKNYFSALSASAILKSIYNGDIESIIKIINVLEDKDSSTNDNSMDSLIEAVKSVRKYKPNK